jgi:DNA helicase-2/ATP-dependent DNA helicase PcrA
MNLVRHERGLSVKDKRFRSRRRASSIEDGQRPGAAGSCPARSSWCSEWKDELRDLFDAYVAAKAAGAHYDDLLLTGPS